MLQFSYKDEENANICNEELDSVSHSENLSHLTEELSIKSRQHMDEFIVNCCFAGEPCGNVTEIFEPIFTGLDATCLILGKGFGRPKAQVSERAYDYW